MDDDWRTHPNQQVGQSGQWPAPLHAIIDSGKTLEFLVVEGVANDSFKVMDSGMARRPSDAIMDLDLTAKNTIMAVGKLAVGIEAGINLNSSREMALVTRVDQSEWVRDHADFLSDWTTYANLPARKCGGTQTAWLAFLHQADRAGFLPEAKDFVDAMVSGANLAADAPALALRNWLTGLGDRHGYTTPVFLATFIRVFADHLESRSRKLVRPHRWTATWPTLPTQRQMRLAMKDSND